MATFIDDQGGTGWRPGSHLHFRLAAAWLPTTNVGPFKAGVQALRAYLGVRADFEFKFSKTHNRPEWRTPFYNLALGLGLHFTACSFDKRRIRPGSVTPLVFHQVAAVSLAAHLRATYLQAEAERSAEKGRPTLLREPILVDDNKDKAMLAAIEGAFRALKSGHDPAGILTIKPDFRDSEKDETVQLADMVMGAVGAHLDGDSTWFDVIRRSGQNLGVVQLIGCRPPEVDDLWESV